MKQSKSAEIMQSMQQEYVCIYIRSRIGRYLCQDHIFRNEIKKARTYTSIASCMSAIAQMKPEARENLMKRGAYLSIAVTSKFMLPTCAFVSLNNTENEPN